MLKISLVFQFLLCLTIWAQSYSEWGSRHFGDEFEDPAKLQVWGQNADPDGDGLSNLLEYVGDLDPTTPSDHSELYVTELIPAEGTQQRHLMMRVWQRIDDPDLVVRIQGSVSLGTWSPAFTGLPESWEQGGGPIFELDSDSQVGNLRQHLYVLSSSVEEGNSGFMRLFVGLKDSAPVVGPAVYPVSFTSQPFAFPGSRLQSNQIIAGGFVGSTRVTVSNGGIIFVNGIEKGAFADVVPGDVIWIEAVSPLTGGQTRSYTVALADFSTQWFVGTKLPSPVPDHEGDEAGYAEINASVSETGAAQLQIPLVLSPGIAGMMPGAALTYSSQGGSGFLGEGFSFSGLSSVSRVGASYFSDGEKNGVKFHNGDHFTIDGSRLVITDGVSGEPGSYYKTQIDQFSRVSLQEGSDGEASFQVETKSGLVNTYGSQESSRVKGERLTGGYAVNDYYDIFNGNGTGIDILLSDGAPTLQSRRITSLRGIYSNNGPGGSTRHWGQGMEGYIVPKIDGDYEFRTVTTYRAYLAINPNGESENGLEELGRSSSPGVDFTSRVLTLEAGKRYRFKALFYQYKSNGQQLEIYWKGPGIPSGSNGEFTTLVEGEYLQPLNSEATDDPVLAWSLDKTRDTLGNQILYKYDSESLERGETLVSEIAYTVEGGESEGGQKVTFEYENKPDRRESYVSGSKFISSKRLSAIETFSDNQRIRRYEFDYKQSLLSGKSLLINVREISPNGLSRDVKLDWMDGELSPFVSSRAAYPSHSSVWNKSYTRVGDFDGDGKSDLFSQGDDGDLTVMLRKEEPDFEVVRHSPDEGFNRDAMYLGDFDADGLTDVLTRPGNNTQFVTYFSNGDGTFRAVIFDQEIEWDQNVRIGDFNGDGRTDVFAYRSQPDDRFRTFLSNGDGTFEGVVSHFIDSWNSTIPLHTGDFDGDGLTDIGFSRNNTWFVWHADSEGLFVERGYPYPEGLSAQESPVIGDFNGDGISDLLSAEGANLHVLLFDGLNDFQLVTSPVRIGNSPLRADAVGNFNSDRMTDVLSWTTDKTQIIRYISTGNGAMEANSEPAGVSWDPDGTLYFGDFDGDGKGDMTTSGASGDNTAQFTHFRSASSSEDLISQVTRGNSSTVTFEYSPLTDDTIYKRSGRPVEFPCHEFQASLYVVSAVEATNGLEVDPYTGDVADVRTVNRQSYKYEGAWTCLDGRGFQGFKASEVTDETSGIVTRTENSDQPLLGGRPILVEQSLSDSTLISRSTSSWAIEGPANEDDPKVFFIRDAGTVSEEFEINSNDDFAIRRTETREITYDGFGNLLTMTTDYGGGFTEATVNTYDNVTSGDKWHLGRLRTAKVTKTATGSPAQTRESSFAYDSATGLLKMESIEPNSGILPLEKTYIHDGFGNIVESLLLDPASGEVRTTGTGYTADHRFVESTENTLGHSESKTFDQLLGNVLSQTGPNGLTTSWEYDDWGRPIKEVRADGTEIRTFYRWVTQSTIDAPPRAIHYVRSQSSGSAASTTWFDLLDREIARDSIGFDGRTIRVGMIYNQRGELTHQSEPFFLGETVFYTDFEFDAIGRPTKQTAPGGRVSTSSYDGLSVTLTNPSEQTTTQLSDLLGRSIDAKDNNGNSVTFARDPFGNVRFVTDPAGNKTEMRYDIRGNKVWMSEPNSGVTTYVYNAFGELVSQTDAKGQKVSLSYDDLGRLVERSEPEGRTIWEYDTASKGIGKLSRVYTADGTYSHSQRYDELGRPSGSISRHGNSFYAVSSSFDSNGRPDTLTYPSGFSVRNVYNSHGHLSEVQNAVNPATRYWQANTVNARGQVENELLGNGLVTQRAFDADRGLIKGIKTGKFGGTGIQDLDFTFDDIGNLVQRRDLRESTPFVEDFRYDPLNRLERVDTSGSLPVSISYNALGNITARSDVGVYNYGQNGAGPHAVTGITSSPFGKNNSYRYDLNGNRTSSKDGTVAYTSFNKPSSIQKGDHSVAFKYAPNRSRYQQISEDGANQTVKDYVGGFFERDASADGVRRNIHYIRGGGGVVAIYTSQQNFGITPENEKVRYLHRDHLGSITAITNESGGLVERLSFDAWGQRRSVSFDVGIWSVVESADASSETNRGFTGHEMLDAVGLIHMNGRVYDPVIGRFLSPDPFVQAPENLQSLNRYSYVLNNPLSFTDPSGFFFKSILKFIKKHIGTIAAIGIGVLTGGAFAVLAGAQGGILGAISAGFQGSLVIGSSAAVGATVFGAGIGFGSSFSGTLLSGGSVGDALRAGLRGGLVGAAQGRIAYGIGNKFGHKTTLENLVPKTISHGAAAGGIATISGGNFKHGFVAAAIMPSTGLATEGLSSSVRFAVSAIAGGTASELGGGKFSNGAVSGATIYLFNEVAKPVTQRISVGGDFTLGLGGGGRVGIALTMYEGGIPEDFGIYFTGSTASGLGLSVDAGYGLVFGSFEETLGYGRSIDGSVFGLGGSHDTIGATNGIEITAGASIPISVTARQTYTIGLSVKQVYSYVRQGVGGLSYSALSASGGYNQQDLDSAFRNFLGK
ncbi:FG-GAP-like repeat-containing protein [bacterium]|nr:FG-GAP-like repeat-containing protein [bacterium]